MKILSLFVYVFDDKEKKESLISASTKVEIYLKNSFKSIAKNELIICKSWMDTVEELIFWKKYEISFE